MAWLEAKFQRKVGTFQLSVDLEMDCETAVFFGPSGSGKSQTLRLIAGLAKPDRGFLKIDGQVLTDTEAKVNCPARDRQVGLVFQELALFPHMTLQQNVSYGIGKDQSDRRRIALEWLDRVGLAHRADDFPSQLSGGQKQRVSIIRALAAKPRLLLLDEPFSALDGPLRRSLRRQLRELQLHTGIAMIYVTHNPEDLSALSDRVFLFRDGKIHCRVRGIEELSRHWHEMGWGNLLPGQVVLAQSEKRFQWDGGSLVLPCSDRPEGPCKAVIAPDAVHLCFPDSPVDFPLSANRLQGEILERYVLENIMYLCVQAAGMEWQVQFPLGRYGALSLSVGHCVDLLIPPESVQLLEPSKGSL